MAFGFGIGKNKVLVYSVDEFSTQVNGIVDPKLALKQDKQVRNTVTLSGGNSWTASGNLYTQTVNVAGVTPTNTVFVSADPTSADNWTNYNLYGVYASEQQNGSIVFTAKTKPSVALTANVVIMGV